MFPGWPPHHLDELSATAPRGEMLANRAFALDGRVSSNAGMTTGIDLFLHRIAGVVVPAPAAHYAGITPLFYPCSLWREETSGIACGALPPVDGSHRSDAGAAGCA